MNNEFCKYKELGAQRILISVELSIVERIQWTERIPILEFFLMQIELLKVE